MNLEQAMAKAPDWATEVFVRKSDNYWYAGNAQGYSYLGGYGGNSHGFKHGHSDFSREEITKDTWERFPINLQLENE